MKGRKQRKGFSQRAQVKNGSTRLSGSELEQNVERKNRETQGSTTVLTRTHTQAPLLVVSPGLTNSV